MKTMIKNIALVFLKLFKRNKIKSPQRTFLEKKILPNCDFKGKVLFVGVRGYCKYDSFLVGTGEWITLDIDKSVNPDVVGDVCDMTFFDDEIFDWVIFNGVFEYLSNPQKGINEIYRVMRPEAKLLFGAPYHTLDNDGSFWRITPAGVDEYLCLFKIEKKYNIKNKHIYTLCKK